jgi:hypothetical protein
MRVVVTATIGYVVAYLFALLRNWLSGEKALQLCGSRL